MTAPRAAPGADAPAGMTVLTTVDGKRLAKVVRQEGDGPLEIADFDYAFEYSARPITVVNTVDLYHRLSELQDESNSCIVRGAIAEGANPQKMLRRAIARTDSAPTLVDVPRSVAFFDFDLEMTEDEARQYQIVADPDGALEHAFSLLPEEFRKADFVYSFGSSAGIKPGKLSLHLGALLDRPVLGADLKALVEKWNDAAGRMLFDTSIYGADSISRASPDLPTSRSGPRRPGSSRASAPAGSTRWSWRSSTGSAGAQAAFSRRWRIWARGASTSSRWRKGSTRRRRQGGSSCESSPAWPSSSAT